jgi:hypothetical protein
MDQRNGLEAEPKVLAAFVEDVVLVTQRSIQTWPVKPKPVRIDKLQQAVQQAGQDYIKAYPQYNILSRERHEADTLPKLLSTPTLHKEDTLALALDKSFHRMMKRLSLLEGKLLEMRPHIFSVGFKGFWKPNAEGFGQPHQAHVEAALHDAFNRFLQVQRQAVKPSNGSKPYYRYLSWDLYERVGMAKDVFSDGIHQVKASPYESDLHVRGSVSASSVQRAKDAEENFFKHRNQAYGNPRNNTRNDT